MYFKAILLGCFLTLKTKFYLLSLALNLFDFVILFYNLISNIYLTCFEFFNIIMLVFNVVPSILQCSKYFLFENSNQLSEMP